MANFSRFFSFFCFGFFFLPVFLFPILMIWGLINFFPALEPQNFQNPFLFWFHQPKLGFAVFQSLSIAFFSSVLSLSLAFLFFSNRDPWAKISLSRSLFLLFSLSFPHLSLAIGVKALLSESGLFSRIFCALHHCTFPFFSLAETWPTLCVLLTLSLKELFFFLYLFEIKKKHLPLRNYYSQAMSLGYTKEILSLKIFIPLLWPEIRWPFLIVFSYSLASVDVPLVFFQSSDQTLSLMLLELFSHPENPQFFSILFAGSFLLLFVFLGGWMGLFLLERVFLLWLKSFFSNGKRVGIKIFSLVKKGMEGLVILVWVAAFFYLGLNSFASQYFFPELWPKHFTLQNYTGIGEKIAELSFHSLALAFFASLFSFFLSLLLLEVFENSKIKRWVIFSALFLCVLPQISFVFCFQIFIEFLSFPLLLGLFWIHSLFVFSYLYLLLAEQNKTYDLRFSAIALSLQKSPSTTFWKVKFPLLRSAFLGAFGMGMSVSFSQYLPTLFTTGGRFSTLMVETLSLLGSYALETSAPYAFLLSLFPFAVFLLFFYADSFWRMILKIIVHFSTPPSRVWKKNDRRKFFDP